MSGSNQATNLTGMLNQIGQQLGKDRDISSLTRGIENMSRPSGMFGGPQPGEDGYYEQLANWQTQMGRPQEAAVTANLMQQEQLKRKAEADASVEATDKLWTANFGKLVGKRAQAVQDNNFGLVNEIDREMAQFGPRTEKQLMNANRFRDTLKAQDDAIKGARSVADVEAYDELSKQQDEYRAKLAGVATDSPEAQRYQQIIDGMERSREAILKANPDAVKAMQDIDALKASQAANMETAKQQDASNRLWEAAKGGSEKIQELLDQNPELAQYAGNVLEAVNKFEEEKEKVLSSPASVEGNTAMATELKAEFAALPGITASEIAAWNKRVDALSTSNRMIPRDAQEELLKLKGQVYTRAGQLADIERSAKAGEQVRVQALSNSIATRTITKAERDAAKALVPGEWYTFATTMGFPEYQSAQLDTVAKDQKRMQAGLETAYQYDESGKVVLGKDNKFLENPNFGADTTRPAPGSSSDNPIKITTSQGG